MFVAHWPGLESSHWTRLAHGSHIMDGACSTCHLFVGSAQSGAHELTTTCTTNLMYLG